MAKFADIKRYPNVIENVNPREPKLSNFESEDLHINGQWSAYLFKNDQPLVLELACGRGDYTLALARTYPEKNFLGVDVKGNRIWTGAKTALEEGIPNAAFFRTRIEQLPLFFAPAEVSEVWITFPDPFLRESKENRRLTAAPFLDRYRQLCAPDTIFHLKTDDDTLYQYSMEVLSQYPGAEIIYHNDNIYAGDLAYPELAFKTHYEVQHLQKGRTIKYIRFALR